MFCNVLFTCLSHCFFFFAEDFEHPSVSESDDHAPEWEGPDGTSINNSGSVILHGCTLVW